MIFTVPIKKLIALIPVILICSVSVFISASCGNALKFKNDGATGNLIDEANDRYYIYCLGYLQAAAIKPQVYAKGDRKERLHEVIDIDPAKWLSEDISNGVAFLFREQSEEEPTLEGFGTEIIHITMSGEITLSLGAITDKKDIDAIVNDYAGNKEVPLPEYITESLTLNFASEKYKGIYYVLQYFIDDKGKSYLYDRWTKRCVLCSVSVLG